MSVHSIEGRPRADEPAVHDPRLRMLVEAATAQPTPALGFDETALHAAWRERRQRRRRMLVGGFAAAASIALVVSSALRTQPGPAEPAPADRSDAVASVAPSTDASARPPDTRPEPAREREDSIRLADAIDVRALGGAAGAPEILGAHRVYLPAGRWSVDSRSTDPVEVVLDDGTLRLVDAHVRVEIAADVARVEVVRGEVERFDRDGQRLVDPSERSATAVSRPTGPDALARDAEAHMEAGRPRLAIKSLRRLVTQHPRASATPAGLIDLGRLLERVGRVDDARCAYSLFLARWPRHPLGDDITRARRALGDGPECRGLRPVR